MNQITMKVILLFVGFLVAVSALPAYDLLGEDWRNFKVAHQKTYKSAEEELKRLAIYKNNIRRIREHNSLFDQGKTTYKMGMNRFGDWTPEEFLAYVNRSTDSHSCWPTPTSYVPPKTAEVPSEVDWRTQNVVTEVKDQGNCGSCWAFSATGSLEAQLALKTGKLVSLSEQNLVDCTKPYGNFACHGGYMNCAFDFVKDNGISTAEDYPYTADGYAECTFDPKKSATKASGYVVIQSETDLALALATVGPISVGLRISLDFEFYESGIFVDDTCYLSQSHAALVVGYADEYYIIKNSWGAEWGESGYFKWKRGVNQCGITSLASYPTL